MLMVGLDPDPARLPLELADKPGAIYEFCKAIVDVTADYTCGIKPQIAYFAAQGAEDQLQDLCDYIRSRYPHLPIVLDAKRGDVGSTAEQYAREAFERYRADAVTVSPYMGFESNPGGSDLQFMEMADGTPLYLHVASLVAEKWNKNGQCALVVGATFPDEIGKVRARIGDMPLLVPGIGAQGGDIVATVAAGMDSQGNGMMINSSRAILYASRGNDWRDAAQAAAIATRNAINDARDEQG